MSHERADRIAAIVAGTPAAGDEKPTALIDPASYSRDDVREILAAHDICALY